VCKFDRKEEVHCYSEIKAALRWSTSAANIACCCEGRTAIQSHPRRPRCRRDAKADQPIAEEQWEAQVAILCRNERHIAGFDLLVVLLGPVPCTALFIGVECGDSLLRTHVLKIPASSAGWAVLSVAALGMPRLSKVFLGEALTRWAEDNGGYLSWPLWIAPRCWDFCSWNQVLIS